MAEENEKQAERTGLPKAVFAKASDQLRVRTDRFRQIYANNMAVNFSSWDLGVTFGEIVGEKDGQPVIEETVRVMMTREIAKVMAKILTNHIAAYEAQFGEIRIPLTDEEAQSEEGQPAGESVIDASELAPSG